MSETAQIVFGLIFLALIFFLTRIFTGRKMGRVAQNIVTELQRRGASDQESAVPLAYEKRDWLTIGLRDYRPKALEALVSHGVVARTPAGRYYLANAAQLGHTGEDDPS
jgi:hypothetical protein